MTVRRSARKVLRVGVAALAVPVLLTGCTWTGGGGDGREPRSRDDRERAAAGPATDQPEHVVVGPTGTPDRAGFELVSGVTAVTVRAADLGDRTYRISTPDGSRVAPVVRADPGGVRLLLEGTGLTGPATAEVLLNRATRWQVRLGGGAEDETVDLSTGRLGGIDLVAGATRVELSLPVPDGTVGVRMSGGASRLLLHVPAATPVRLRVGGGAGTVTVDGTTRSGVSGGTVVTPPGWDTAADRYDVDAAAGASTITVDRR